MPGRFHRTGSWRFATQIALPTILIMVLVAATTGAGLFWVRRSSDEASVAWQIAVADNAIAGAANTVINAQERFAVWDEGRRGWRPPEDQPSG